MKLDINILNKFIEDILIIRNEYEKNKIISKDLELLMEFIEEYNDCKEDNHEENNNSEDNYKKEIEDNMSMDNINNDYIYEYKELEDRDLSELYDSDNEIDDNQSIDYLEKKEEMMAISRIHLNKALRNKMIIVESTINNN